MSRIKIVDLEVFFSVGVSDAERAKPQRLLITVDITFDFTVAAVSDRITKTIDYGAVAQHTLDFGNGRNWKLIEKLAATLAESIMSEYKPESVSVEVKKFVIPQAAYVSVIWVQKRGY